ncbi:hypothetical protein D3C71_1902640 [compost metagenome]
MPIGVPISVASVTITSETKMAFARPPASLGGGVMSENSIRLRPPRPRRMVSHRIQISQNRPKAMAASASVSAIWLTRLRPA